MSNVLAIAAGNNHSLALKSDGALVGWGLNGNGQATAPAGLSNVVAISAGGYHSMVLRLDGTVLAWGNNFYGQTNVPVGLSNVVAIAAGEDFSLALKNDGTVSAWGSNIGGETVVPSGLSNVVAIAAGARHCLAYLNDGAPYFVRQPASRSVYSGSTVMLDAALVGVQPISLQWQLNGANIFGATNTSLILTNVQTEHAGTYTLVASNAVSTASTSMNLAVNVSAPVILNQPTNYFALFGKTASFSVSAIGSLPLSYQWQFNGSNIADATTSTLFLTNVTFSNEGSYSVTVTNPVGPMLSSNATLTVCPVVAWGAGLTNSAIDPNFGQSAIPTGITNATRIAAGGYHSMALLPNGRIRAWGYNNMGQTNVPVTLADALAMSAGLYHSLALRSNGTVIVWGNPLYGIPSAPASATNVATIACGWFHNLVLRSNGTVIAWGAGMTQGASPNFGQSIVPANVSNVSAIAAGAYHSLALRTNGTVAAWGLNSAGQTNVPIDLSNVVSIAAGASNCLALKSDGMLVAWGDNTYGQTNIPSNVSNVVAIASGMAHNVALKNDDSVVTWGLNGNGQTAMPSGLPNVAAISGGAYHSMALVNEGSPQAIGRTLSQASFTGSTIILYPGVVGAGPMTYQWQFNGTNVSDATNATLFLTNLTFSAAGLYTCVVSNGYGVITNLSVALNVLRSMLQFTPASPSMTADGNFTFALSNLSGHGPVVIYASTNLSDWQPIFTNPPVTGVLPFTDSSATNSPMQFYRAIER